LGRNVMLRDGISSGLAPELLGGDVLRVVESLVDEGKTLLMVTNEKGFARKVSDRVNFMRQGRVHEMGPPDELFVAHQTAELRQFLASMHCATAQDAWDDARPSGCWRVVGVRSVG
jgi:polar amino acid transport system ATP-binding protein